MPYDGLVGDGKALKTELDFFVEAIKAMREIRVKQGFAAGEQYQKELVNYFHIHSETNNTFVFDDLLRLASVPAGSLLPRDEAVLDRIHRMVHGDRFTMDGRACYFVRHMRTDPTNNKLGFFEYNYAGTTEYRPIDYTVAWNLASDGKLVFG